MQLANERELIKRAVEYLDQYNSDGAGTNNARIPHLIVGMGEQVAEVIYEVRRTLDQSWSNAMHLEFLNIAGQDNGGLAVKRFRCQEEYEKKVDTEGEDVDRNEWISCEEDFQAEAVKAQYRMLEKVENFSEHRSLKIDFVLDATDDHTEEYYEIFKKFEFTSNHMQYKTLYLLLSQKDLNNSLERSEKMLQKVLHDDGISKCCVYIISDELSGGSSLSKEKLKSNYRLIADLIFLSGDRDNAAAGIPVLDNGVKLVSYTVFSKPGDQIGEVAIGRLFYLIYDMEEKRFNDKRLDLADIKARIGLKPDGQIDAADYEWTQFKNRLPRPNQNPVQYFPYADKNAVNEVRKAFKSGARAGLAMLGQKTYGVSNAYIKKKYEDSIGNYFEEIELRDKIRGLLKKKINYFELLQLKPMMGDLKDAISMAIPDAVRGTTMEELFQSGGENIARKKFYSNFKDIFCEVLEEVVAAAEKFQQTYKEMRKQLDVARSINGEEEASIESFYGNQVEEYLRRTQDNSREIAFPEFFDIDLERKQMLTVLFSIYEKMVENIEVYAYDFEQELRARMENLTPQQVTNTINQHFTNNMQGDLRLHVAGQINPELEIRGSYYLLNTNAAYYKYLREADDFKEEKYRLIELRRSDCIEQLSVYTIKNVDKITIMKKKGQDSTTAKPTNQTAPSPATESQTTPEQKPSGAFDTNLSLQDEYDSL